MIRTPFRLALSAMLASSRLVFMALLVDLANGEPLLRTHPSPLHSFPRTLPTRATCARLTILALVLPATICRSDCASCRALDEDGVQQCPAAIGEMAEVIGDTGATCWIPGSTYGSCVLETDENGNAACVISEPCTVRTLYCHSETLEQGCGLLGCTTDPCGAGATCVDTTDTGYTCTCGTGYAGDTTDTPCVDVDGCDGDPCGTGATCADAAAPSTGYTCTCGTGYAGDTTDTPCVDVDGCDGDPCGTGATCVDTAAPSTGYTCTCGTGYARDTTDTPCVDVDGCDGDPCGTGATCVDTAAPATGYACTCGTGYVGDTTTDEVCGRCRSCHRLRMHLWHWIRRRHH
eukprot:COSAG03_NODE_765_length_5957_cov_38.790031_5_plen_347_part_00